MKVYESIVIGAGQAGLSASFHLRKRGIEHLVLDANSHPGGAWQHRWKTLTMHDVHGISQLPDMAVPRNVDIARARDFVPGYLGSYEELFNLPIRRPVRVRGVQDHSGLLEAVAETQTFTTPHSHQCDGHVDAAVHPVLSRRRHVHRASTPYR